MRQFGLNTDLMPESYRAESIVEAFSKQAIKGANVLLPRAKEARPILPVELKRMGANVDEVAAYQTIQSIEGSQELIEQLNSGRIDMVTFTSSSTVRNFKALLPQEGSEALMASVTVASIGPITAETAETLGFRADIVATEYTIDGLCDAILDHYSAE